MKRISKQITSIDDIEKLDKVYEMLQEWNSLTQDEIGTQYTNELERKFAKSFDSKIQELIKESKLSRLEEERKKVKDEKISLLGKLLGKERLRQVKLNNIDLSIQLIKLETRSR